MLPLMGVAKQGVRQHAVPAAAAAAGVFLSLMLLMGALRQLGVARPWWRCCRCCCCWWWLLMWHGGVLLVLLWTQMARGVLGGQ